MQKAKAMFLVGALVIGIALTMGCVEETEKMDEIKTVVVYVNTKEDFNQYAGLAVAFDLKADKKIENVVVFYGPAAIGMSKKGALAKYPLTPDTKALIASQYDSLTPDMLPDNLELLARYLNSELGVKFYSCGTFNALTEGVTSIDDVEDVEDFITPLRIPDAVGAAAGADKIVWL